MSGWRDMPGGYAIKESAPNVVEIEVGAERCFEVRGPEGTIAALALRNGLLVCSCQEWGCSHEWVVQSFLALDPPPMAA